MVQKNSESKVQQQFLPDNGPPPFNVAVANYVPDISNVNPSVYNVGPAFVLPPFIGGVAGTIPMYQPTPQQLHHQQQAQQVAQYRHQVWVCIPD